MKKNATIKLFPLLMVLLVLCQMPALAAGDSEAPGEISPRYSSIMSLDSTLAISRFGKATCSATAKTANSNYSVSLVIELLDDTDDIIESWSDSGEWSISMEKGHYVSSGSTYHVIATATVYDANGKKLEVGTVTSNYVYY